MAKIDIVKEYSKYAGNALANYYDSLLLNQMQGSPLEDSLFGKIIGYKNIKVPKYLTIKIPVIEKDYDFDSEYGDGSFRGYLISFREIKLFRIGTKIERMPIRRKATGKSISWRRYNPTNKE